MMHDSLRDLCLSKAESRRLLTLEAHYLCPLHFLVLLRIAYPCEKDFASKVHSVVNSNANMSDRLQMRR